MASGQRVMCVWQAVAILDPGHSATMSTARRLTVQDVTCNLSRQCPSVHYSEKVFMDNFPKASVEFDDYVNYVKVCLRDHSAPMNTVEDELEINCWEICKDSYALHHCSMSECEVFKLWQIFNKLCVPGTMPPVMEYDDVQWLGLKFAKGAKQRWSAFQDGQHTFMEMLTNFDSMCFKMLSHGEEERVLDSVHSWLVREVCLTGWMSKRTRKQANWTSWQRRWFVLKPGLLSYYTSAALTEKKGDVILTNRSRVDDLGDLRTLIRHYPNRFRITNAPFIELELSNEEFAGKDDWMRAVKTVIKAVKTRVSPSECILSDIRKQQRGERLSEEDTTRGMSIMSIGRRLRSDGDEEDDDEDDVDGARHSGASSSTGNFDEDYDAEDERHNKTKSAGEDAWLLPFVLSRLTEMAEQIDEAEEGNLDEENFKIFLDKAGIGLSDSDVHVIFEELVSGECVPVQVFLVYLLKALLFTKVPETETAGRFFQTCMQAHCRGTCMLNLQAFTEMLWQKQRIHYVNVIMRVLDGLDGEMGDTLSQLRSAFSREQSILGTVLDDKEPCEVRSKEMLKQAMQVNVDHLAQYMHHRWTEYPLKRDATETKPAGMPHEKILLDVVFFHDQNAAQPVASTRIKTFTWKRASKQGKCGTVWFHPEFDGVISAAEPTQEVLLYYGACRASQHEQLQSSLMYKHHIHSFRAPEQGQEAPNDQRTCLHRQDMPALLCPLEEDSGLLVLGKQDGRTLELTAFHIPTYHTVYIPSGTIFCTSYARGMWRTMMMHGRAEGDIAQVFLMDSEEDEGTNSRKSPVQFRFSPTSSHFHATYL